MMATCEEETMQGKAEQRAKTVYVRPGSGSSSGGGGDVRAVKKKVADAGAARGKPSPDSPENVLVSLQQMHKHLTSEGKDLKAEQEKLEWMRNIQLPISNKTKRSEACMGGCNGMYSEVTHVCRECCNYLCRFCATEHMTSDDSMCHEMVTWDEIKLCRLKEGGWNTRLVQGIGLSECAETLKTSRKIFL